MLPDGCLKESVLVFLFVLWSERSSQRCVNTGHSVSANPSEGAHIGKNEMGGEERLASSLASVGGCSSVSLSLPQSVQGAV